jgi:hypothetical protein
VRGSERERNKGAMLCYLGAIEKVSVQVGVRIRVRVGVRVIVI